MGGRLQTRPFFALTLPDCYAAWTMVKVPLLTISGVYACQDRNRRLLCRKATEPRRRRGAVLSGLHIAGVQRIRGHLPPRTLRRTRATASLVSGTVGTLGQRRRPWRTLRRALGDSYS